METPITPRSMSSKSPKNPRNMPPRPSPAIRLPALQATAKHDYASNVLPYFFLMETPLRLQRPAVLLPDGNANHAKKHEQQKPEESTEYASAAKPGNPAARAASDRKAGLRLYRPAVFFPDGNADHAKKHEQQNARRASRPCLPL